MTISSDYLDMDSSVVGELLSPAQKILDNDAIVKSIEIFFNFQLTNHLLYSSTHEFTCEPYEIPKSDLDLFNLIKADLSGPPEDEEEEAMSQAELMQERDPQGICQMPFESEKVQQVLAEIRANHQHEQQLGAFEKVQAIYREALQDIHKELKSKQLTYLQITVIYAKKPDLDKDLILSVKAGPFSSNGAA